jgi:NAD(P)-dependent dehydrogenase (short-subunit alcohol dehydrogenase family)
MTNSLITAERAPQSVLSADLISGLRVAVTGGTSGLGLALVRELVSRGARVAFVARTRERVEQVCAKENPGAHGIVGDVSKKEEIYPIAIQITGELGGLDVLINNASSLGPTPLRCSRTLSVRISKTCLPPTSLVHSVLQKH